MADLTTTPTLCCLIFDAFRKYIHVENNNLPAVCLPETCKQLNFIKHLETETNAIVAGSGKLVLDDNIEFQNDIGDKAIADILVYAYIGRHYTDSASNSGISDSNQDHLYFKFHAQTQMLRAVQPHCLFERSVYLSMIILTVLILVFLLLARHIPKEYRFWRVQEKGVVIDIDPDVSQQPKTTARRQASHAIDFGHLRRR
mgnify:CR=1 FL=1